MGLDVINVGGSPNDGTGDSLRAAFVKANTNFSLLSANSSTLHLTVTSLLSAGFPTSIYISIDCPSIILVPAGIAYTLNLPSASAVDSRVFYIVNTSSSSNIIDITPVPGETINNSATLPGTRSSYQTIPIISSGTAWYTLTS